MNDRTGSLECWEEDNDQAVSTFEQRSFQVYYREIKFGRIRTDHRGWFNIFILCAHLRRRSSSSFILFASLDNLNLLSQVQINEKENIIPLQEL